MNERNRNRDPTPLIPYWIQIIFKHHQLLVGNTNGGREQKSEAGKSFHLRQGDFGSSS